ncbi:acetyl/propionyl/methylcrotonyl-CoA carboxylase subunit alpha [Maritalea porphyrae]|uniref:3-methylcrotonyl-CoA carboxylase subunit alpha n=1 Tax=Maritalea porphyrae TaxID=880732 RepID=A0ABQ5URP6_9HYPH|nr:acetyl/propionyl/methylcrotonyl-CoA carboxylase subunit alpha [Maritalea porphyrae]GLQ17046.1 3-methylcrotonyl-CoA carboxylase subunit alpha [Maritalea porphyrae]
MFKKILIANRGEIACRVMRTAQMMGVKCVAVYSDADANAQHVKMADEAYRLGPAPVAESYLRVDKIIEAIQFSGAEAVHPGYGFLSENPDFVAELDKIGVRFIGPSADAIRAMGLKDAAKALMEKADVPVVPGYHGDNQDPDFLAAEADKIGYPVLIKARAGGGGKGMRRVDDPAEFKTSLESASREGQSSFGDGRVLIEKYITTPRHIEIQVFGDDHGNAVHLFERDCSLQRRHQKVIEEAPAPGMTQDMRNAMGDAAVKAAKAINYSGAGTIEFIVDASNGLNPNGFYFMEMNTRLQVEHPVTEMITGQDLVAWQLRVASGETLPKTQDELSINGWAFEARLYAEDVPKGFLPATGTLAHLALPQDSARIDSGVVTGDVISPFYDPMIAKITVHGESRKEALNGLASALGKSEIAGSVTNRAFLAALCAHKGFAEGDVDTGLIDRDLVGLIVAPKPTEAAIAAATLIGLELARVQTSNDPWDQLAGWRTWSGDTDNIAFDHDGARLSFDVALGNGSKFHISDDDTDLDVELLSADQSNISLVVNGQRHQLGFFANDEFISIFTGEETFSFDRVTLELAGEGAQSGDAVLSPMPGSVVSLNADVGQQVQEGDKLVVVEAMKMEHALLAPRDGIIEAVFVSLGDQVEDGALLIQLESDDE